MELPQQNEYIDARERFNVPKRDKTPKVDKYVSEKVGKTIYTNDPIVLKTIVGWKRQANKDEDDTTPDNFLEDPKKVEELKKALNI
jgi:hypothetical protein